MGAGKRGDANTMENMVEKDGMKVKANDKRKQIIRNLKKSKR